MKRAAGRPKDLLALEHLGALREEIDREAVSRPAPLQVAEVLEALLDDVHVVRLVAGQVAQDVEHELGHGAEAGALDDDLEPLVERARDLERHGLDLGHGRSLARRAALDHSCGSALQSRLTPLHSQRSVTHDLEAPSACACATAASSPSPCRRRPGRLFVRRRRRLGRSRPARLPAHQASAEPVELRLGYFPNVTHATALAGIKQGFFEEALPDNVTLTTTPFNAGPEAVEAIFSGGLDASFIGPNPAINAFARSKGEAIRIVSGATSGGAYLVVKPEITSAAQLKGKKLATPQLGNTQDVALRAWLKEQGLSSDAQGGGDVSILPQPNAQTLDTFRSGDIDGAWVPEPWATRLVQEGGGTVLVDERDLWPDGQYVTTHLVVTPTFLEAPSGRRQGAPGRGPRRRPTTSTTTRPRRRRWSTRPSRT